VTKRKELHDLIDSLAVKFGPHCPDITCTLNCLVGAIDGDTDRELAGIALNFARRELVRTAALIASIRDRLDGPTSPAIHN